MRTVFAIAAWLTMQSACSSTLDEEDLALVYGHTGSVSIASGSRQTLARAPAAATVVTARDIAAMGAEDLDQVLESVPGLHISVGHLGYAPIYSFRGSFSNFNPQVLMLVNGVPITSIFAGNRSFNWGGMPVENIARVEVIRGPGSALYGADAYSGVINVITKGAADINGLEGGVRLGSFRTRDAWLQYGGSSGALKTALYLRAGRSDGHGQRVERDAQSFLDGLFGTRASLAPGPVNVQREALDVRSDLAWGAWRWRAAYQNRKLGTGAGLAESLDPVGRLPEQRVYSDLTWERSGLRPGLDLAAVLSYQNMRQTPGRPAYRLFPPGAFGNSFPAGVIGSPGHSERTTGLALTAVYQGWNGHRLRLGGGYRIADLYETPELKNFDLVARPGVGPVFIPLGAVIDATNVPGLGYMTPHKRVLRYLFVQDEWNFARDWSMTAGVRHDRYSDFGGTTNPRLALLWDAAYNVIVKLMHGRAFRAPSYTEQYTLNNPVNIGNPAIRPETIGTTELQFSWQGTDTLQGSLTLFHYRMHDIISATTNPDPTTGKTFNNGGGQTGRGAELEAHWQPQRRLRLSGSLSLQRSADTARGSSTGMAPNQRLYLRADWHPVADWQLGAVANRVAERRRAAGDSRPPVPDYTSFDLSVERSNLLSRWALRASVHNLLDAAIREPSFGPGNIPFDLPLSGRAFSLQLRRQL